MDITEKLREAIKIPTFWPAGAQDTDNAACAQLEKFQAFLTEQFPLFHKTAERWAVSPFSLVYRLAGNDGSAANDAVLFLAHYDVVPAETEKWSVDPFGADVKEGPGRTGNTVNYIYGRGSLDMKSILISIMEAAEQLCAQGWKPKCDVWFAFGGDEERDGIRGAMETVKWFEKRGQRFKWVLDEGTPIAENQIDGITAPLALVSIEEKGYLSLKLAVEQAPGHASQPPKVQAAAVLGRALCRIAKKPFPFRLSPTVEAFFRQISPLMPGIQGFAMRHCRLLGQLFFKLAASTPTIEAMLRTTIAMTRLSGSPADNVLPSQVSAIINLRLLWPWTVKRATDFIEKAINDKRVTVSTFGLGTDPVPSHGNFRQNGWRQMESALNEAWPGIAMFPFIMIATTDSRHFQNLSESIFRFNPYILDPHEMEGIHGHNERISEENLRHGLMFYTALMRSI